MNQKPNDQELDRLLGLWAGRVEAQGSEEPAYNDETRRQLKESIRNQIDSDHVLASPVETRNYSRRITAFASILAIGACFLLALFNFEAIKKQAWPTNSGITFGDVETTELEHANRLFKKYSEIFGDHFYGYTETSTDIQVALTDIHGIETITPRLIKLSYVEQHDGQTELIWECNVLVTANEETLRTTALIEGEPVTLELWTHLLPDGKMLVDLQCLSSKTRITPFSKQFLADDLGAVNSVACWEHQGLTGCLLQSSVQFGDQT